MRSVLTLVAAGLALAPAVALAFPQSTHPAMTKPSLASEKAPDTFKAKFDTTKGEVVFDCTRAWAPNGVDRFYNLVKIGFFDDIALFRVAKGFVVQWGIHGDPKVAAAWRDANLPPDPPKQSNTRGMLTYAMAGSPDTRSTQLFINYGNNAGLDAQGFAPICKVASGMEIADSFFGDYGEELTELQGEIQMKGNAFLREKYPKLDYVKTATIVGEGPSHDSAEAPAAPKDPGTGESSVPWVVGGLAIAGVLVFFAMRGSGVGDEPPKKDGERSEKSGSKSKSGEPKRKKKKSSKSGS
jgi:peptidyl-prolyl cis-trans isomerase A (cyclophilin A)